MEGDPITAAYYYPGQPLLEIDYDDNIINDNEKFARVFIDNAFSTHKLDDMITRLTEFNIPNNLIQSYVELYNLYSKNNDDTDVVNTVDGPIPRKAIQTLNSIYKLLIGKNHGGQVILTSNLNIDKLIAIYTCKPLWAAGALDNLPPGYSPQFSQLLGIQLINCAYTRGDSELSVGDVLKRQR